MPRKPLDQPTRKIEQGSAPGRGGSLSGNGQPPFIPTDVQRQRVIDLISRNFTHEQTSIGIGIPLRTLERHFQPELATGKLRVHAEIATGIVEAALNGDKAMSIFYAESRWAGRSAPPLGSTGFRGMRATRWQTRSDNDMSRPCSVCLHPRRVEAEELLRRGWSIRRSAAEIGIRAAALHRHWRRHVANRDTTPAANPVTRGSETPASETLDTADPRQPAAIPRAGPSTRPLIVTHPAGGQPFCWCARCLGRRWHYAV
jgi:hypothetical protein